MVFPTLRFCEQLKILQGVRKQAVASLLVALVSGCAVKSTPAPAVTSLTLSGPIEHLATFAVREPMVVEHPEGALFVAGFTRAIEETQKPPKLFISIDGGTTWEAVDVGSPDQGAVGNSDVDLAVAPDGTLYFLTMGFDRTKREGTHISVGVSRDVGETWTWTYLSKNRFDDRPWIKVTPEGVAHVIWNDGQGVCHTVSTDVGQTWIERPRINPQGGSSHLAVGPGGEIAVRITPVSASGNRYDEGVELIAVSVDGGETWEKLAPPGNRAWSPADLPRWVEPLAWDAEGTLYHLWSEGSDLWLGRSQDRGETWESWTVVTGEDLLYFPYLVARGHGELAATWFSGFGDNLLGHVALIDARGGSQPLVRSADPFQLDCWSLQGDSQLRDPGGEDLPVLFLSGGYLCVVTPIQNSLENRQGFSWYRVSY
jgi:hypothetical protein